MKNKLIIFLMLAVVFGASSCNKFLDTPSDNRTELVDDDKIRKILVAAYPDLTYATYTDLMSDDHDDIGTGYEVSSFSQYQLDSWRWRDNPEESQDTSSGSWSDYYSAIGNANMALKAIEDKGNPASLDPMRGEALLCRAFCHFRLVNLFSMPYSEDFGDIDMGIPYSTKPSRKLDEYHPRETVRETYRRIREDLETGLELINDEIYTVPKFHFNTQAAYGFAAEFYLYIREYDKAIECANVVLGDNPETMMRDVSGFRAMAADPLQADVYTSPAVNANLLLTTCVSGAGQLFAYYFTGKRFMMTEYVVMTETVGSPSILWREEESVDSFMMPTYSFASIPSMYVRFTAPLKFEYLDPVAGFGYTRSVCIEVNADNVLLCRAEANALNGDLDAAMVDINHWINMRIVADYRSPKTVADISSYYGTAAGGDFGESGTIKTYTPKAPTPKKLLRPEFDFISPAQESMIHAILHLRRIEFMNEGRRWFDVRRYNIPIYRRQARTANTASGWEILNDPARPVGDFPVMDVLKERDPRMAIQIPSAAIQVGIERNPR